MSAVNLGTTTLSTYYQRINGRQIVKASNGTLLIFANITNDLVYKKSTDDGVTWDSSWTNIETTPTYINSFTVTIDSSDNVHIVYYGLISNSRMYYNKLSYVSGTTWTLGTKVLVQAGSSTTYPTFAIRSNGDYWIATARYLYYSSNSGASWTSSTNPGSSTTVNSIMAFGSNMLLISLRGTSLDTYEYASSWSSATNITTGVTSSVYGLGCLKISDTDIWASVRTGSGSKIYHYDGSWDSGELISDHTNDYASSIANINGNPVTLTRVYDGSANYDLAYRVYNGTSWDAEVLLTDDSISEKYYSALISDSANLYSVWQDTTSSPRIVYFEKVAIENPEETIDIDETLNVSELVDLNVSNETIEVDETVNVSEGVVWSSNSMDVVETLNVSDTTEINKIEIEETVNVSDDIELSNMGTVSYPSKIISYNPLLMVTDTSPAKLIEVNVSDPANPTWSIYTLIGVSNANSITYNSLTGYIYVFCDSGEIKKIHKDTLSTQTLIDTLDTHNLQFSSIIEDQLKNYVSTSDNTGEIILLDEAEVEKLNLDIRYAMTNTETIPLQINTVLASILDLDIRVAKVNTSSLGVDIRFLKYSYSTLSEHPIDYTDWIVKINDVDMVPLNDIDMKSIAINLTTDAKSSASFLLHRQHDKLNFTNAGTASEITDNNTVKIYIDGNLVFDGKVSSIDTASEDESVIVTAQASIPTTEKNSISLPLPSVNEQLNLYHCLVDNVTIDNPYIDSDEENPEYYKGIMYDKGTLIKQKIARWTSFTDVVDEIEAGTFTPKQAWSYFWFATIKYLSTGHIFGATSTTLSSRYIGTSLSPISSDVIELDSASYKYQRIYDDVETDLSYGYLGEAPYLEISGPNGILTTAIRWEDRADGLYEVKDDGYSNLSVMNTIAGLEYEKLQNINGDILPITNAELHLSLNAYFFYNVNLLSRVNLTNTTTEDIYNELNGFPVAVKSVRLTSNDMKAVLICDNQKSQEELDAIDDRYPEDDAGIKVGYENLVYPKYDVLSRTYPE